MEAIEDDLHRRTVAAAAKEKPATSPSDTHPFGQVKP